MGVGVGVGVGVAVGETDGEGDGDGDGVGVGVAWAWRRTARNLDYGLRDVAHQAMRIRNSQRGFEITCGTVGVINGSAGLRDRSGSISEIKRIRGNAVSGVGIAGARATEMDQERRRS